MPAARPPSAPAGRARYTNRARSQLRYGVDRATARLIVTVQYTDAVGGKLELRSTYSRSTP
jgi:hypothetical protein